MDRIAADEDYSVDESEGNDPGTALTSITVINIIIMMIQGQRVGEVLLLSGFLVLDFLVRYSPARRGRRAHRHVDLSRMR